MDDDSESPMRHRHQTSNTNFTVDLSPWIKHLRIYNLKKTHLNSSPCVVKHPQLPDIKVHGANMGSPWVLSAPDGPHEPCYQGGSRISTKRWPWWGTYASPEQFQSRSFYVFVYLSLFFFLCHNSPELTDKWYAPGSSHNVQISTISWPLHYDQLCLQPNITKTHIKTHFICLNISKYSTGHCLLIFNVFWKW